MTIHPVQKAAELTLYLEDLFNDAEIHLDEDILSEECKCEAEYHYEQTCIVKVVALLSFKCEPEDPMLVCQTIVDEYYRSLNDICTDCGQSLDQCWSIRPV